MILHEAGIGPGMTVLDFGCGPGGFTLAAARLVGAEGRVHAFDVHPLAAKTVHDRAIKQGLDNVRVSCTDSIAGIAPGTLDAVLLYDILHDLPRPEEILAAAHRALKPRGTLSVSDHHLKKAALISTITRTELFYLYGSTRWTFQFGKSETSNGES